MQSKEQKYLDGVLEEIDITKLSMSNMDYDMDPDELFRSFTQSSLLPAASNDIVDLIDWADNDGRSTPEMTIDDFLDQEKPAFTLLNSKIRQAVNVNTRNNQRIEGLSWLFIDGLKDKKTGWSFLDCCEALCSRQFILRARALHQLWKIELALSTPLPNNAVDLPSCLINELDGLIGIKSVWLANLIWRWPGIPANILESSVRKTPNANNFDRFMNEMEANGYIGLSPSGGWFFISRNYATMTQTQRLHFSWAKSFLGDD